MYLTHVCDQDWRVHMHKTIVNDLAHQYYDSEYIIYMKILSSSTFQIPHFPPTCTCTPLYLLLHIPQCIQSKTSVPLREQSKRQSPRTRLNDSYDFIVDCEWLKLQEWSDANTSLHTTMKNKNKVRCKPDQAGSFNLSNQQRKERKQASLVFCIRFRSWR